MPLTAVAFNRTAFEQFLNHIVVFLSNAVLKGTGIFIFAKKKLKCNVTHHRTSMNKLKIQQKYWSHMMFATFSNRRYLDAKPFISLFFRAIFYETSSLKECVIISWFKLSAAALWLHQALSIIALWQQDDERYHITDNNWTLHTLFSIWLILTFNHCFKLVPSKTRVCHFSLCHFIVVQFSQPLYINSAIILRI